MYIRELKIENFRGIKELYITFNSGLNYLIGANNVGKSSILTALDLLLNPFIRWWREDQITEFDFWNRNYENDIKIEVIICCGYKTCVGEDSSCPYFERGEEYVETCKMSEYTQYFDKENPDNQFPNVDELQNPDNLELALQIRMIASYNDDEGFIDVNHEIIKADGEWYPFTRAMKQWIGANLFTITRDPSLNFRIQYNSLLKKFFINLNKAKQKIINKFKDSIIPVTDEIFDEELKEIFQGEEILFEEIPRNGKFGLGMGPIREFDILRQIELCLRIEKDDEKLIIPFSRQGQGLQNLLFLYLCGKKYTNESFLPPIILLEEPEQNLEPQRQRNLIKLIRKVVGEGQIILTTHSPFVLIPNSNLQGVQRLILENNDILKSKSLSNIKVGRKDFIKVRQTIPFDVELFESLFSNLIVIWEGVSEAGFYPKLMRRFENYPSEWLTGITGAGSNVGILARWLKKADYKVICVVDGDNVENLRYLKSHYIPFVALPDGFALEKVIETCLNEIEEVKRGRIILKSIGSSGEVYYNAIKNNWGLIDEIFNSVGETVESMTGVFKPLDIDVLLDQFEEKIGENREDCSPTNINKVLKEYKRKAVYETLADELFNENKVPELCKKVLDLLKGIWNGEKELDYYQFSEDNSLRKYTIDE